MQISSQQPTNLNDLSPVSSRLVFHKIPHVVYRTLAAPLPGIQLGEAEQATPLGYITLPGYSLVFDALSVAFVVDEDLNNWKEIYNWMTGLGVPKSSDQYAALLDETIRPNFGGYYSDASMIIYNNMMVKIQEVKFENCFPISLTAIEFDSRSTDINAMQAQATFKYVNYEFVT